VNLIWGEALHRVLAHWYTSGGELRSIVPGEDYYREHYAPTDDADNAPKTCAALGTCFKDYVRVYEKEDQQYTTLAVEIGFKLEIAPGVWMSGRIDQILQDNITGDIVVRDHKSSSRLPDAKGINQWQMNPQAACYLTAAKRKYPEHHVREFEVNVVVPRKVSTAKSGKQSPTGLQRISVGLTDEQLKLWKYETTWLHTQIVDNILEHEQQGTLDFSRNPTSCYDFGSLCTYFDQCSVWTNPLDHIDKGPPRGMCVDHWNPLEDLKCEEVWELPL
jgi:hypothetical protein